MHLFDIDIPGKIRFQESETLSPGNKLTTFQMSDICRVGIGICYDIRFAEMAQLYARDGTLFLNREKRNRQDVSVYISATLSQAVHFSYTRVRST